MYCYNLSMSNNNTPFAAFVICYASGMPAGSLCATTRAADRGESGQIGLPGGKIDFGEDPAAAALREAAEEGWKLPSDTVLTEAHRSLVDGHMIVWLKADKKAVRMVCFKERGRIRPIVSDMEAMSKSGFGNDWMEPELYQFDVGE